ncbi:START-like domain-containing protein [Prevotella multiformis]|uniref:START-like domain-containing protein n=1 Tax=Prevotella multiformis TaxID=282402 RepID=UPI0028DC6A90|nr:START-like domain-containing protein [Prevotella multiformis]
MSRKIELEYELKTRSGSAVWTLISTPVGLKKWLADDVFFEEDVATFVWGDPLREHETHTAIVIEMVKNSHIRLHWDSSDSDAYWEIRMFHSEIAGNYHLAVTDFTEDDEPEDLVRIWDQNIDRLHRITGV